MSADDPFYDPDGGSAELLGRSTDLSQLSRTLRERERLLIVGASGVGKTALLTAASREEVPLTAIVPAAGISTIADLTTRLLHSVARTFVPYWGDALGALIKGIGVKVALDGDPSTGLVLPTLSPLARREADQAAILGRALDLVAEAAREREADTAICFDDVDELARPGRTEALDAIASALDRHTHVGYVLTAQNVPEPLEGVPRLELGPPDQALLAGWIDDVLRRYGVKPQDTGSSITALCEGSTDAVLKLARLCLDEVKDSGFCRRVDVERAFDRLVALVAPLTLTTWRALTQHQQSVLRAVATCSSGLTTAATRDYFLLGDTGTTHNSAQLLIRKGLLQRQAGGYVYRDPFVRGWVIRHALPDVGVFLPTTHLPTGREP